MHDAATVHVLRYAWPEGGAQVLTPEQLRKLIRDAYIDGYTAGRESRNVAR